MTALQFLSEWALRSSALIACGAVLLWMLRVKDPSLRLTSWTAMLVLSAAIPVLAFMLPKTPIVTTSTEARPLPAPATTAENPEPPAAHSIVPNSTRVDWPGAALVTYSVVSLTLLLRLCVGVMLSLRLLRRSHETDRRVEGIPILESAGVAVPVTLGIVRPAIVLPHDWREWDETRLSAVLAHETSHVRRRDPAVQLLSALHRAVLWHSPMSWFLHSSIVRTAEEVSDDAALIAVGDRAFYAQVLLEFMQRAVRRLSWAGVPMARYGNADSRINRILDGAVLSRGVTGWSVTAILCFGVPLAYIAATVHESQAAPQLSPPVSRPVASKPRATVPVTAARLQPTAQSADARKHQANPHYMNAVGTVTATTLVVKAKFDGELKSLGFEEGKPVEAGQLIASVEQQDLRAQFDRAQRDLADDKKLLAQHGGTLGATVRELEGQVRSDERQLENLRRALASGEIHAPFAGIAGLRKVDPSNLVRAGDTLVVIAQVQPIAVLFNIPEDKLPAVLTPVRAGASLIVEAWNRDNGVKLATGRLTAVDNLIDTSNGTASLKAMFDNKDSSLFPNQFVNVRVLLVRMERPTT